MRKIIFFTLLTAVFLIPENVFADSYQDKLDFASYLEETLGHFWAIEQNLDDNNSELALVHATHPIAELYDLMKPQLSQSDPELDQQIQDTLMQLQHKANTDVSRDQAQNALEDAKNVIEIARSTIVGDELSNDPLFKAELIKTLLETSVSEYREAVSEGTIEEMAEFQDCSAFVWRSEQIFETIQSDIDSSKVEEINDYYNELWSAIDGKEDSLIVDTAVDEITHEINEVLGVESHDDDLLVYVENIEDLLTQTKQAYENGNHDLALSYATKAYLDNFEYLEHPLIEAGQEDLVKDVEIMLREDLRNMIKTGEPVSEVNTHVDSILEKMDTVSTVVPEFGTVAMVVLAAAIVSIIVVTTKSRITIRA